jgi:hypothetical protein
MDLLKAGESSLRFVKSLGMPLGHAKTASRIGFAFSYTAGLSHKVLKSVKIAVGPSDFSALALDTLNLARSFNVPKLNTEEISKLALSVLKKGCVMLRWVERYRFIALESALLGCLERAVALNNLAKAFLRLLQDLGPARPVGSAADGDLVVSVSKILKFSLLLYAYLFDDKRVKVVTKGIRLIGNGYSLCQKYRTMKPLGNPREWTITWEQMCQIISSVALAALALYGIEKGYFSENSR